MAKLSPDPSPFSPRTLLFPSPRLLLTQAPQPRPQPPPPHLSLLLRRLLLDLHPLHRTSPSRRRRGEAADGEAWSARVPRLDDQERAGALDGVRGAPTCAMERGTDVARRDGLWRRMDFRLSSSVGRYLFGRTLQGMM